MKGTTSHLIILGLCLLLVSVSGCNKDNNTPNPCIYHLPASMSLPPDSIITFSTCTNGSDSVSWNFGDAVYAGGSMQRTFYKPAIYHLIMTAGDRFTGTYSTCAISVDIPHYLVRSAIVAHVAGGSDTSVYTYDNTGRLLSETRNRQLFRSYSYNGYSVDITDTSGTYVAYFDDSGYIRTDSRGHVYLYDENSYITSDGDGTFYYNARGDKTSASYSSGNVSFTYAVGQYDTRYYGKPLFGRASRDLVTLQKIRFGTSINVSYSYTFDSQGRVATQTDSNGEITTYQY